MNRLNFLLRIFCISSVLFLSSFKKKEVDIPEAELLQLMKQYDAVGMSVAVVKNGEIIYTNSFGLKDKERNIPLSDQDIFRIASISKSFSATALMQLIEKGKVSLDDDVSDLVGFKVRNPRFPEMVITLRMILSHTSSINDSQKYSSLDIINPSKNAEWSGSYNNYKPGDEYEYCNLNYNMAGAIIERISGERFDHYIKSHILDPLGLYGGYLPDSLDSKRFAKIYKVNAETGKATLSSAAYKIDKAILDNYVLGYNAPVFSPTGGMKISATDLAKYMIMHMNKGTSGDVSIISEKSAKEMQSEVIEINPLASYGLAIRIVKDLIPGETLKGHTGSAYGLFSSMFFHPDKKYGIVVITNGSKRTKTGEFNSLLKPVTVSLYNHFIK